MNPKTLDVIGKAVAFVGATTVVVTIKKHGAIMIKSAGKVVKKYFKR